MAAFHCSGAEYLGILEGYAGQKAGLALTRAEILRHIPDHREVVPSDDARVIRVRREEMESAVRELLFELGVVQTQEDPHWTLTEKYFHDAHASEILARISDLFFKQTFARAQSPAPIDATPIFEAVAREYGARGIQIMQEYYAALLDYLQGGLAPFRRTEWTDVKDLDDLFTSGSLAPTHGAFIDQRFVDYLSKQFEAIDSIHWRQFEALTAEFFSREGCEVSLGPGQDDGGVDVRVWRDSDSKTGAAPTILIQCKRQKAKVGQVVVKALWADVVAEHAESGLIVTTSALQPGAKKVCVARGYHVSAVDRATLAKWLSQLRTPGSGVFMSR